MRADLTTPPASIIGAGLDDHEEISPASVATSGHPIICTVLSGAEAAITCVCGEQKHLSAAEICTVKTEPYLVFVNAVVPSWGSVTSRCLPEGQIPGELLASGIWPAIYCE